MNKPQFAPSRAQQERGNEMLFHAESPCSWRSSCGRYQLVYLAGSYGVSFVTVNIDGVRERTWSGWTKSEMLEKAQRWCKEIDDCDSTDAVLRHGNGIASEIDDDNIAQRHRFGGDIEPLSSLDSASRKWLVAATTLVFLALILVAAMTGHLVEP
jgi:hypothetical protein